MSHEITYANGRASMAYTGETPWHGLGQELTEGAPLETWAREAGMDWEIKGSYVRFQANGGDNLQKFDKHVVLYRDDTGQPLSVVSNHYKPVQPGEVLEFFRNLTESHNMQLETAGVLRDSTRYWALARTGVDGDVAGDQFKGYVLLATSCDGSLATIARLTSVRVVCQNTLSMATVGRTDKPEIKVRHSSVFDATKAQKQLGLIDIQASTEQFLETMGKLAEQPVTDGDAKAFFHHVLTNGDFDKRLQAAKGNMTMVQQVVKEHQDKANYKRLWNVYKTAPGQQTPAAKDTAYGVLQAVTRYVDHDLASGSTDKRLNSAWFGYGQQLKQRSLEAVLKVAG